MSDETTSSSDKSAKSTPWYIEIPIIIVLALLISIGVQTFIGRIYVIPSE